MSYPESLPYPSWTPTLDTGLSKRYETLLLATLLVAGLMFVTPVLALLTGLPALVFVVFVGGAYGALAILLRRVGEALAVALVITATFNANLPLPNLPGFGDGPAHLGFVLWLVHLPILGLLGYVGLVRDPDDRSPSIAEMVFGGFVVWTGFAAAFGATRRPDVAIYFAAFMFVGLVVLTLARYLVQHEIIQLRTLLDVFVLTGLGHSVVAIAQLLNGTGFGLTTLGGSEGGRSLAVFSFGSLGEVTTGVYVAGFTGWPFHLAAFLTLAIPAAIGLAAISQGWRRWLHLVAVGLLTLTLRFTATDAGRGGLLVACLGLAVAVGYHYRDAIRERSPAVADAVGGVAAVIVAIGVSLIPSSKSGDTSTTTDIASGGGAGGAGGTSAASSGGQATRPIIDTAEATLRDLSIPFFDLTSLGVRLKQYVGALDLFAQHPVFGIGGANFPYYALEYGLSRQFAIHSIYLGLLAGVGLPGLVLFLGVLAAVFWAGLSTLRDSAGREWLPLASALCGLIAYLAFGAWATIHLTVVPAFVPFWALAGAVVGHSRRAQNLPS